MMHSCDYCQYQSSRKYNLHVHMNNKHGIHSTQPVAASKPHPYVHPYMTHANQQTPSAFPPRTPEMIANNTYYAKETRAPTKMSVGPNGSRAPTTVSIPPLYGNGVQAAATQQHASNPHPHLNHANQDASAVKSVPTTWFMAQHPHGYEYGKEVRAPTKVSVGPDWQAAPSKISVAPSGPRAPTTILFHL